MLGFIFLSFSFLLFFFCFQTFIFLQFFSSFNILFLFFQHKTFNLFSFARQWTILHLIHCRNTQRRFSHSQLIATYSFYLTFNLYSFVFFFLKREKGIFRRRKFYLIDTDSEKLYNFLHFLFIS